MNLSLTPSLAAAESRPGLLPPTHATPVPVVPTLSAMSMVWVTQCVSASVDMFQLRTPSLAARSSLTHATPTHVDQELTVFPPETEQLADVLLDTRETHLLAAGRENVSMITSVLSAWHVLTTTAETPVLAPVVRTLTARSEITDQSAAVRRGSEAIL